MGELRSILEDTVSRLFGDRVTKESVEAAERGDWQADLWRAVEEAGLTRPHLTEAAGGAGGSWLEAYVILRATGRHTVPLPIAETVLAGWLLAQASIPVPDGPITVLPEPVAATALRDGTLSVVACDVPWARVAPHAVFATTGPGTLNCLTGLTAGRWDGARVILLQELFATPYFCIEQQHQHPGIFGDGIGQQLFTLRVTF